MSWDIIVMNLPDVPTVAEIPEGFQPPPIGPRSALISRILAVCPQADFSDPAWGIIQGADWSIEVNVGTEETCSSIALHVRGGDTAMSTVATILGHLRLRGIDVQTGEFFVDGPESRSSFRAWREYRDRVVGEHDRGSQ